MVSKEQAKHKMMIKSIEKQHSSEIQHLKSYYQQIEVNMKAISVKVMEYVYVLHASLPCCTVFNCRKEFTVECFLISVVKNLFEIFIKIFTLVHYLNLSSTKHLLQLHTSH